MIARLIIPLFDAFLADRGLALDAVVIGGAALGLLGIIDRHTRDCDILHPALPDEIRQAARDFANERGAANDPLQEDWLNNGPASLVDVLPVGWESRCDVAFSGSALTLRVLGRADLLKSKLFALCDRGTDIGDCIALAPTPEELDDPLSWVQAQDANPQWPAYVETVFADLREKLGHGV